jgi:CheY-like chemotaxis protein
MDATQYPPILIVDDSPVARQLLRAAIAAQGYPVAEAAEGEEALDAMRRQAPALVFLDLQMPGRSGVEVCAWMRQQPALARVPVVICSAHQERKHVEACLQAGATAFLPKPVSAEAVADCLRRLLPPGT